MVSLKVLRAHNTSLKTLSPNLVAVFVGGTSGIGLSTAREFVRNTHSPHVYLIGRNSSEATRIISELQSLNAASKLSFIQSDTSLLKNVDAACEEIKARESKVNLLFMTIGQLTTQGYNPTSEGLDKKLTLHYYARARFTNNLLPLLTAASQSPDANARLSRVVSVLDPKLGRNDIPNFNDLALNNGTFSLKNCATHASAMINFSHEHLAATNPGTAFVHMYPSMVPTNIGRDLGSALKGALFVAKPLLNMFMVPLAESGERHLYASTAPQFAPGSLAKEVESVARGGDEVSGSGSYVLNWADEVLGESKKAEAMRKDGALEKVWKHTQEVFGKVETKGKY
jgi:NAD(P)-dependent dehydrogenase (short-subunit alcohol dehydrogenase family)